MIYWQYATAKGCILALCIASCLRTALSCNILAIYHTSTGLIALLYCIETISPHYWLLDHPSQALSQNDLSCICLFCILPSFFVSFRENGMMENHMPPNCHEVIPFVSLSGAPDEAHSHRGLQRDHQDLRRAVWDSGALQQRDHREVPTWRQRQRDPEVSILPIHSDMGIYTTACIKLVPTMYVACILRPF